MAKMRANRTYAVDAVMQQQGEEYRHQDDDGDDDQHHERGPQPEREQHQDRDRPGRDEQLEQQLVHLVVGGLAVVARHRDVHVVRDERALQGFHHRQHPVGHGDPIAPLLLGDGQSYRGLAVGHDRVVPGRPRVVGGEAVRLLRSLVDGGHIAHVHRLILADTHHQARDLCGRVQERAGEDGEVVLAHLDVADLLLAVGRTDGVGDLVQGNVEAGQTAGQGLHPDLLGAAAHDETYPCVRDLLQALQHVQGEGAQRGVVDVARPEGEVDDGHVVDALGLDHGLGHAGGNQVEVRGQLVVELEQRGDHVLAHNELDRHHATPPVRGRVDVLHAGDLAHQPFQGIDGETGHLLRRGARIGDVDVHHGHGDLGVLLARGQQEPQDAHGERS